MADEVRGLVPAVSLACVYSEYGRNPKRWWPLIPGGITAVIGLSFLIAENIAQYVGAIALVAVGVWILVRQFVQPEPADQEPRGAESDGPPAE